MLKNYLLLSIVCLTIFSCGGSRIPDFGDETDADAENTPNEPSVKANSEVAPVVQEEQILPIQKKYAKLIGITPEEAKSVKLYNFIDRWEGTPYLMGGENKRGIDCSFFSQFLYHDVFNCLIERTAEKQFVAPTTDKFIGQEYLAEGDLLFFNLSGSQYDRVTHVGVYIGHGKFVHSTSRRSPQGSNGVQISDFNDRHWQKLFVAAGRKACVN